MILLRSPVFAPNILLFSPAVKYEVKLKKEKIIPPYFYFFDFTFHFSLFYYFLFRFLYHIILFLPLSFYIKI